MPRGRPRKLQGEENGVVLDNQTVDDTVPVRSDDVVGDVAELKKEASKSKFLPYTGKDDLPPAVIDKRGRVKKAGEPRYFLNGNSSSGYKLIRVYRNGKGIGRSLVRVLKTSGRTASVNKARYAKDRAFLDELRKAGIPGY